MTTGELVNHQDTPTAGATANRRAGLAGIGAAVLFPTLIVLGTALQWDYMHQQWGWRLTEETAVPFPSGLATGPWGFLQITNFAVTGLLVLVFGQVLASSLRVGHARHVTRFGMGVMGVALMASTFPTDFVYRPAASPPPETWHGMIHTIAFFVLMLLGVLPGTIGFALGARRTRAWSGWALPTLLVPLVLVAMIVGLIPDPWGFYLLIVAWFGWMGLAGAKLRRLA